MNKTSLGFKFVNKAAKSPALLIIGPDVALKPTPSSIEIICASVVLPNPGDQIKVHDPSLLYEPAAAMKVDKFF